MSQTEQKLTPCPPGFTDHIYKIQDGVKVPLRVWGAPKGTKKGPWMFWMHGGGWQAGKHFRPNWWTTTACRERGYTLVSVAYRYLPEVSMEDQHTDLKDAYAWCRAQLPSIVGKDVIDVDAFVVGGDSAGGTMSLQMGDILNPPPRAVIDCYGVADSERWNHKLKKKNQVSAADEEDDVRKGAESRDASKAEVTCTFPHEWPPTMSTEQLQMVWGTNYTVTEKDYFRQKVIGYIARHALFLSIGFRRENFDSDEAFLERVRENSPINMITANKKYPPTFILHGTADEAVPIEDSYMVVDKLKGMGIPVDYRWCEGGPHEFEGEIYDTSDPMWEEYIEPTMDFVDKYVKR